MLLSAKLLTLGTSSLIPVTFPFSISAIHFPMKECKVATADEGVVAALQAVTIASSTGWSCQWAVRGVERNWNWYRVIRLA